MTTEAMGRNDSAEVMAEVTGRQDLTEVIAEGTTGGQDLTEVIAEGTTGGQDLTEVIYSRRNNRRTRFNRSDGRSSREMRPCCCMQ